MVFQKQINFVAKSKTIKCNDFQYLIFISLSKCLEIWYMHDNFTTSNLPVTSRIITYKYIKLCSLYSFIMGGNIHYRSMVNVYINKIHTLKINNWHHFPPNDVWFNYTYRTGVDCRVISHLHYLGVTVIQHIPKQDMITSLYKHWFLSAQFTLGEQRVLQRLVVWCMPVTDS